MQETLEALTPVQKTKIAVWIILALLAATVLALLLTDPILGAILT